MPFDTTDPNGATTNGTNLMPPTTPQTPVANTPQVPAPAPPSAQAPSQPSQQPQAQQTVSNPVRPTQQQSQPHPWAHRIRDVAEVLAGGPVVRQTINPDGSRSA